MKTVLFTEFRKKASRFITEVEHGETIILLRRGRPIAEVIPLIKRSLMEDVHDAIVLQITPSAISHSVGLGPWK